MEWGSRRGRLGLLPCSNTLAYAKVCPGQSCRLLEAQAWSHGTGNTLSREKSIISNLIQTRIVVLRKKKKKVNFNPMSSQEFISEELHNP